MMKSSWRLKTELFQRGGFLSLLLLALSFLLVQFWLERPYYYSILLPALASLELIIAWFIYLIGDNLLQTSGNEASSPEESESTREEKLQNIERQGFVPYRRGEDKWSKGDFIRLRTMLLWSSLQLYLFYLALYYLWGVGASYYE